MPNAELTRRGLARDDLFTVVHEQFLTDTARYADIVLPATTQLEATDVVPAWGHLWMGWNEAAIAPLGEACSNTELFRRLAGAMGFTEPALFDDDETLLARRSATRSTSTSCGRVGWVRVPYAEDGRPWASGVFPTTSGKVELVERAAPRHGPAGAADVRATAGRAPRRRRPRRPLPVAAAHTEAPQPLPELGLLRTCPSTARPRARRSSSSTPADAAARGLADGDAARVWNDRATVELPVRVSGRLRPGVVVSRSGGGVRSTPTTGRPTR